MGGHKSAKNGMKWQGLKFVKMSNIVAMCKGWVGVRVPCNGSVVAGLKKIELQQAMCRSVPNWLQLSFVLVRYLDIVTLSEFCGAKRCVLGNTILLGAGPECGAV